MLINIQLIISIVLIVLILLQERGGGVSGIFGGHGGEFYQTRRGLERVIFYSTIVLVAVFIVLAILNLVFKA
ncbi:MAG: preprotein translocase subunit SecG [Candidatus Paceibacterota bacterium]|jgi:protein translocase SecG subunit